jgi:hypothetical protein
MDLFLTKIAHAATATPKFDAFLGKLEANIINPIIEFLFALAVVFFLYGVLEFFLNQDNEEKKTTGKQHMLWGIVGIAIMIGVFTIMEIILNTLDIPPSEINPRTGDVNIEVKK